MTDSAAWLDLDALEVAIYTNIAKRYNGSNNGRIPYSANEAAERFHVSKATGWHAIQRLQDNGFIVAVTLGAFSLKKRHATEWRLTEFPCDVTKSIASKDFMRWQPRPHRPKLSHKKQNTGTPVKPSGTPVKPNGYPSETVGSKNPPHGYPCETVKADFSISRFHGGTTYSLPGRRSPIGERQGKSRSHRRLRWTTPAIEEITDSKGAR